jgi:hypothetical protein
MPTIEKTTTTLDSYELAAVLAGLRLLQGAVESHGFPPGIEEIATNCHEFAPLDAEQIDALCERINCA